MWYQLVDFEKCRLSSISEPDLIKALCLFHSFILLSAFLFNTFSGCPIPGSCTRIEFDSLVTSHVAGDNRV